MLRQENKTKNTPKNKKINMTLTQDQDKERKMMVCGKEESQMTLCRVYSFFLSF